MTNMELKVSLFVTCIIDQFYPEVGESVVRLLRKLGVKVDFPLMQTCCGQPAFNSGFKSEAKVLAGKFLDSFQDKSHIVVPSGSCTAMIKVFYPDIFHADSSRLHQSKEIGTRVFELSEFIVDVLGIEHFNKAINEVNSNSKRKITYHEGCHLRREIEVVTQPRLLIDAVPGVDLVEMDQVDVCCGFGGTFSVKYPDISGAMLEDKIQNICKTDAETLVSCDSSCLMQIGGGLAKKNIDVKPMHLAQFLDESLSANEIVDQ